MSDKAKILRALARIADVIDRGMSPPTDPERACEHLRTELDETERALNETAEELIDAQQRLDHTETALKTAQSDLAAVRIEWAATTSQLEKAKSENNDLQVVTRQLERRLDETIRELRESRANEIQCSATLLKALERADRLNKAIDHDRPELRKVKPNDAREWIERVIAARKIT